MYQDIYNEIYHHGIKGMKWGVRRFQNADGSLTAAGKKRYLTDEAKGKRDSIIKNENAKLKKASDRLEPEFKRGNKQAISEYGKIAGEYDNKVQKARKDYKATRKQIKKDYRVERKQEKRLEKSSKNGQDTVNKYSKMPSKKFVRNTALVAAGTAAVLYTMRVNNNYKLSVSNRSIYNPLYSAKKEIKAAQKRQKIYDAQRAEEIRKIKKAIRTTGVWNPYGV